MSVAPWDRDRFSEELTGELVRIMGGDLGGPCLERALAAARESADEVCRGRAAACSAGCSHCCVLNVAVLLPEALAIADWLQHRLSSDELAALALGLVTHSSWARWMDDEERIIRRAVCPFLDPAGACSIYPVRPLACRGVTSLDAGGCAAAFDPVLTDEVRTVPADLLRRAVFDAAFVSLASALQQRGLDDRSIEVGSGVLAFLRHPAHGDMLRSGGRLPGELWS